MYDKYEAFMEMGIKDFAFPYKGYEVWIDGIKINDVLENGIINLNSKYSHQISSHVISSLNLPDSILSNNCEFDVALTQHDRIQLLNIPEETNCDDPTKVMIAMMIGYTRERKFFADNEPFIINLFTVKGMIKKISFVYSNPSRLIEFN